MAETVATRRPEGVRGEYKDDAAEWSVLGAAMLSIEQAHRVAEELTVDDFTNRLRRIVYRIVTERALSDAEAISPGIVLEDMGPDVADDEGVDLAELQTRAQDSPGAGDPDLFEVQVAKLRRLRLRREFVRQLRDASLLDPVEGGESERTRILGLLQGASDRLAGIANGRGPELKTLDLAAAAANEAQEAIPWVVPGWLAAGDFAILAGDSGVGKSFLLLELAVALALGRPWFGQIELADGAPRRVLYVDEEQNLRLSRHRIRLLTVGRRLDPGEFERAPFRYLLENGLNLDDEIAFRRLASEVDAFRPDWIFFDSLIRFHRRSENDNAEMSAFYTSRLRPLAARVGAGVVVLHHLGKPNQERGKDQGLGLRLRGASDLKAQVDELFGLEEDGDGAKILSHAKTRWGKTSYPLRLDIEDVSWGQGARMQYLGRADDVAGAIREVLMDARHEGVLRPQIIKRVEAEGCKDPARVTTKHLGELYSKGEISKRPEKKAVRYWIRMFAPHGAE